MHMTLRNLLVNALGALLLAVALSAQASPTYTFAVVPQFPPEQIHRTWTPVLQEITRRTGIQLQLKSYATIPDFEADFLKGVPDFAYMNPYHVVMAASAAGYAPMFRDDKARLKGILVVRKDSPVTSLKQLDGAIIAFPAPNAFGASLYMRALLTEDAGIRFTPIYVKTHSNVYRQVIAGQAQAGGGVQRTLDGEPPSLRANLRVLYETPPAYPHPVAVHPRVPAKVRAALQESFVALGNDPAKQPLLDDIQLPRPVAANYSEYASLKKLGLERYVILKED
jgi:phosphonate transport system substrate-binding protein